MVLKNKYLLYGIFIFILSLIPILSMVFDVQEWDESQYILASYDNYQHQSYLSYETIDTKNNIHKQSFPYPNILYTWSFGAFTSFFNLPSNHTSRLKFTLLLSILLSLSLIILLLIQNKEYQKKFYTLILCTLFFNYFIFLTLWKVRNAQLGAILLFLYSMFFLILSYQKKQTHLYEILSLIFLFASFYWKEQLIAIMLIFPWFFYSGPSKIKKRYRVLIYYILLGLVYLILYSKVYLYSIHSGFTSAQYFYSKEGSHWGGSFDIYQWFNKINQIPMTYYLLLFFILYIYQKDYKKMDKVENKIFFVACLHYILTSILYFYQSTAYIAAINYTVPILLMPYFISKVLKYNHELHTTIKIIFVIYLSIPLIDRLYNNYSPISGKPIINPVINNLPCISSDKIAAFNIYTLTGVYLSDTIFKKPILEYKNMSRQEFLKSLEILKPEIIVYRADPTEYPIVDEYMQLYRLTRTIKTQKVHYNWSKDLSSDVMIFIRQSK